VNSGQGKKSLGIVLAKEGAGYSRRKEGGWRPWDDKGEKWGKEKVLCP